MKYRLLRNYPSSLVPDADKDDEDVLQTFDEGSSKVCMVVEGNVQPPGSRFLFSVRCKPLCSVGVGMGMKNRKGSILA
jgi:hypothetical protein